MVFFYLEVPLLSCMGFGVNIGPSNLFSTNQVDIFDSTDKHWHFFFICERNCSLVHHTEVLMKCFFKWKNIVPFSISMLFWILRIYSIHLCSLYHTITSKLQCSKNGSRISRKIWISGSSNWYNHSSFLKMSDGSSSDKILSNSLSWNSRHHPYCNSEILDCLSYRDSIDDSGKHSHIIPGCTIKSSTLQLYPSENISTTDNNNNLKFFLFY